MVPLLAREASQAYDQRDVGSSVTEEQHDWQPEQAMAPEPETLSLQETRKSYSGAQTRGQKPTEDSAQSEAHSDAQQRAEARKSLNSPGYRNRKSSVMKDDRTSSVMQDCSGQRFTNKSRYGNLIN